MPFDFPSIEPESLLGDSEEIILGKMDWNSTLFQWAHAKDDDCKGIFFKEDAEKIFFIPQNFKHKCHSQEDNKT